MGEKKVADRPKSKRGAANGSDGGGKQGLSLGERQLADSFSLEEGLLETLKGGTVTAGKPEATNLDRVVRVGLVLQAILIPLAIIAGGLWCLYEFKSTKKADMAELQIRVIKDQIKSGLSELEAKLDRAYINSISSTDFPIGNIDVSVRQLDGHFPGPLMAITVKVHNIGQSTIRLYSDEITVRVTKMEATPEGKDVGTAVPCPSLAATDVAPSPTGSREYQTVFPQQTREFPYLYAMPGAGVYCVSFEAVVSNVEQSRHIAEALGASVNDAVVKDIAKIKPARWFQSHLIEAH